MATSHRGDRIRFRYGICLNDNCSKCKSKEVQEIPARKEFVCAECGKELRECPPPKQGPNMKLIGGIAAAVAVLGIGGYIGLSGGGSDGAEAVDSTKVDTAKVDTTKTDSVKPAATPAPAPEPAKAAPAPVPAPKPSPAPATGPKNGQGTTSLGYGKYVGNLKDGKPDGVGRLTFTKSYRLNDEYTAEPGEYIDGMFQNGKPVMVTYFKKDGTVVRIKVN